jgi:hypothetical protein
MFLHSELHLSHLFLPTRVCLHSAPSASMHDTALSPCIGMPACPCFVRNCLLPHHAWTMCRLRSLLHVDGGFPVCLLSRSLCAVCKRGELTSHPHALTSMLLFAKNSMEICSHTCTQVAPSFEAADIKACSRTPHAHASCTTASCAKDLCLDCNLP